MNIKFNAFEKCKNEIQHSKKQYPALDSNSKIALTLKLLINRLIYKF